MGLMEKVGVDITNGGDVYKKIPSDDDEKDNDQDASNKGKRDRDGEDRTAGVGRDEDELRAASNQITRTGNVKGDADRRKEFIGPKKYLFHSEGKDKMSSSGTDRDEISAVSKASISSKSGETPSSPNQDVSDPDTTLTVKENDPNHVVPSMIESLASEFSSAVCFRTAFMWSV